MSTELDAAELRLGDVPWAGLVRPGALLAAPLREVLTGTPAERVLDRFLRAHRELDASERKAAAEAVFGVGLWRRRLAWHAGVEDPLGVPVEALMFVLLRDLGGVPEDEAARWSGLDAQGHARPPVKPSPASGALRWSWPDWLYEVFERELGAQNANRLAAAYNLPGPITFRVNTLRTIRDALSASLREQGIPVQPGELVPTSLVVEQGSRPNVFGLDAWRRGEFEVQDEGSQLLGALMEARPGESVLDYCAGAGGKTLQLAAQLENQGTVHAWDVDASRLERLETRAIRAGAPSIRVHRVQPTVALQADRVLVDAPCSETGALRRGPDLRFRIDPASLPDFPPLQRQILENASRHVRPGGRLVYATCSIRREENEAVALEFERGHPDFKRVDPATSWLAESCRTPEGFVRTWPHIHGTDGFFAAVWTRRS